MDDAERSIEKPDLNAAESTFTSTKSQWGWLKNRVRELRREDTLAEKKLWEALRNRRLRNIKFRRQHTIDKFIVDFFSVKHQLIIEVDGSIHEETQDRDRERQLILENKGFKVLRFTNEAVLNDLPQVLKTIVDFLDR